MIGAEEDRMVIGLILLATAVPASVFFTLRVASLPRFPPTRFGHRDAVLMAPRVLTGPEFPIPHL